MCCYQVIQGSKDKCCEEGLNNTEQQSKMKHSANNCKNLPNLADKMMGPEWVTTTEE